MMAAADAGLEYEYAQWKAVATASIMQKVGTAPATSAFSAINSGLVTTLNSSTLPFAAEGIVFNSAATINGGSVNTGIYLADQTETRIAPVPLRMAQPPPTSQVPGLDRQDLQLRGHHLGERSNALWLQCDRSADPDHPPLFFK